ncbi:MAG: hypothetical protein GEV28_28945 [Actinophytocola sp.]|uniref:hypothetical protein n=1 Tax=Actinophytocola sp. TaxID=1872138 RepID=UPI00132C30CA|nr:hypothetical protein [Actinophytocola sp.]MPZ84211.1 hypothetical protein [Actinophytocola sp.]
MALRAPVVTAVVAVVGLAGFMTVNSVGGFVVASETTAEQPADPSEQPAPPAESEAPAAPPAESEAPPTSEAPPPPPAPTFPAEVAYAGNAQASPVAIAVAVKGDEAAAYVCDGANLESWLRGTAAAGKLDLASKDKSSRLTAGLQGKNIKGTLSFNGQSLPFTIGVAKAPAGLYRGEGGETTIGWIVLPNGTQVGISKTGGKAAPAPTLDPATGAVTLNGSRIAAEKVAGDTTFG